MVPSGSACGWWVRGHRKQCPYDCSDGFPLGRTVGAAAPDDLAGAFGATEGTATRAVGLGAARGVDGAGRVWAATARRGRGSG